MDARIMQQRVRETALQAYEEKLVAGTSGNVSMWDAQTGCMAITPSGMDYRVMRVEDVVLMDLEGKVMSGGTPSSEWRMHAELYRQRPELKAVVHTHSPRATSFAVVHQPIPVILIEMAVFLGGEVPLADFALPGTRELGQRVVAKLQERQACLLANHGVVAVGESLSQAYLRAVYVEDAAAICHMARQLGEPQLVPLAAVAAMMQP